jgi:hypothetical protein
MGWDAYASRSKGHVSEFKAAAERVKKLTGSVDWLLEKGGLDCSDCAIELQKATGRNCWDDNGWTPFTVNELANNSYWPSIEDIPIERRWAVFSAKEFLETCAKIGSGIYFSY